MKQEQRIRSYLDLQAIVERIDTAFAGSISFAFLPGDNADNGDLPAYAVVRQSLDQLKAPWCAIAGDHDVEQKSVENFRASLTEQTHFAFNDLRVRAKVWSEQDITAAKPTVAELPAALHRVSGSNVWEGSFHDPRVSSGVYPLRVVVIDMKGNTAVDEVRILIRSDRPERKRAERDQDNALEAWSEHGLLGTQLGPNKNGRQW